MRTIKKLLLIPILVIITMSFMQCSSAQLDKKIPVKITEAFYQDWVGGRPGSKGTLVSIKLNNPDTKMTFDSIYFNSKAVKLQSNLIENELTLKGNFKVITKPNDMIMHADSTKEYGNTAPKLASKVPFELEKDEAVISYIINDKKRYFKVENIKKTKTLFYQ